MTSFYLLDRKQPVTQQWGYPRRGSKLSGTAIIHTAECALDLDGPDTSAEGTANFINNRSDYGSYHVMVDSDSIIWMAPWEYETWQDSETNPWAVGISAAVQAANWHLIPADRKDRIYRNLAVAAADFVKYMKDAYGVVVPLKRINGAQARAGVPGFCAHGDSGVHRSDPGVQFEWDKFFQYTKEALAGVQTKEWWEVPIAKAELIQIADAVNNKDFRNDIATETAAKVLDAKVIPSTDGKLWSLKAHTQGNTARIVELQARVAGLEELVKQVAAGNGIDYAKVDEVFRKALAEGTVKVDVSVNGAAQ